MKPIDREILYFAIPSIVTNITTPLLALMDVAIVGHMGHASYIAAIAVGGTIFNMIYWLFGFLRMGTSGLSARAHGSADKEEENLVLSRGLLVAVTASLLLIALSGIIGPLSLRIMDVDGDVGMMVDTYFRILIWGAPAVLITYTLSGWFLGLRHPAAPMWVSLVINVSNIVISLILVYCFGLKIEGVATGTLSAQWLGAVTSVAIAIRHHSPAIPGFSKILHLAELKRFFAVNADIFLRTLCLIAVTVWFTRSGAEQGTLTLAVNTLLMQFFVFFSYFMDGFAFAGESISGNRAGARDIDGLRIAVNALLKFGVITALIFTLVYTVCGDVIIAMLSDDITVREASREFRLWVLTVPAAGFLAFTWDGVFIGLTATRPMLFSVLFATIIFFIIYFLFFPVFGNHALWGAFVTYLVIRGIILSIAYRGIKV